MSIQAWIADLVFYERLFPLEPAFRGTGVVRHLYMSPEVRDLIDGPWPAGIAGKRCAALRAELEAFVAGAHIGACVVPFKAKNAQMGLLDPVEKGLWDYRSRAPRPGIRVLGYFSDENDFIALVPASRSCQTDFIRLGPLGKRDSPEWKHAIGEASALWHSLFPMFKPVTGDDPSPYFGSSKYHCI